MASGTDHPVSPSSADEILLLMRPGRDRDLIEEWLSSFPRYRITTRESPPAEYDGHDLYIMDAVAWREYRGLLRSRKASLDPVFLPYLLVAPHGETDALAETDGSPTRGDISVLDDIVGLPIEQGAFRRRIENMLRARRASIRLREREEQYEQLVELTPEAIFLISDGTVLYANVAALDLLKVPELDALVDASVYEFLDGGNAETLRKLCRRIDEQGRVGEFVDVVFTDTEDTAVETEVAGVAVTYDGETVTQLVVRDLTEEHRRQQRLDLFGRAIETARQGITIADARRPDYPLVYANDAFEEITGYSTAEVIGLNCRFLQGERTDPGTVARVRNALETDRPIAVELLNYRKDGTPFWNQLEIVPVRNAEGTVTHYLGLQRDVTERREREERLAVLDRVLRHNLRNRLNVIKGYVDRLELEAGPESDAAERVTTAVDDLLSLTEQIREYRSVITTGRLAAARIDLGPRLEAAVEAVSEEYPGSTITLSRPERADVTVHEAFVSSLREFLSLAAATEPGCAIDVTVRTDPSRVVVELVDRNGAIPTFDLQVLERETETPLEHPTGIETWLLRWAVASSGGEIFVNRDEGVATIRIRLPRRRSRESDER